MKILFVCLGNICRSPTAEAVMQQLIDDRNLNDQVQLDSAGTGSWHAGQPADARMRRAASARNITITSISRQVRTPRDFEEFDLIIAMDDSNLDDLRELARTPEHQAKLRRMVDYCSEHKVDEVPDPYYGGADGFDVVIDILQDGCTHLLAEIEPNLNR